MRKGYACGMSNPGFTQSLGYIPIGFRLLRKPGLRRFVWMPILINLMVFGGMGWLLYDLATGWIDTLSLFDSWGDWWIVRAIETLLRWLVTLVLLFSMAFLFTLLANLIGAPFNGLLAERVEAHLTGDASEPSPSLVTLIKSVPRLMGSELAKLLYLVICIVPILILHVIPVINVVAPLVLFLFGAWMFTLEYMDYPLGNHGMVFKEVRREMRQHRKVAYGFGTGITVLSMIPIVNLIVMPVAVAGATALYVDLIRRQDS